MFRLRWVNRLLPPRIQGHQLVGLQKIGASQTSEHWALPDAQNEAKKALKTGAVDVFVMSPIIFPDEAVEKFIKLGLEYNSRMKFIVQLSWGGGDTDNQDFPTGAWENVDRNKTPQQLKQLYARNIAAGEAQAGDSTRNMAEAADFASGSHRSGAGEVAHRDFSSRDSRIEQSGRAFCRSGSSVASVGSAQ